MMHPTYIYQGDEYSFSGKQRGLRTLLQVEDLQLRLGNGYSTKNIDEIDTRALPWDEHRNSYCRYGPFMSINCLSL